MADPIDLRWPSVIAKVLQHFANRSLNWYVVIPQPLRSAVGGAIVLGALGGLYGVGESIHDYPLTSYFGVTLFMMLVGILIGFVLGLLVGSSGLMLRRLPRTDKRTLKDG